MVKSGFTGALITLSLISGCSGSGSRMAEPAGARQGAGESREARSGASGVKGQASPGTALIPDRVLAERGLMTLWSKNPTDAEGPFRTAYLLPEGLFAVSRPRPDVRAYRLIRYDLDTGLPRWFYDLDEPLDHAPVAFHYGSSPEGPRPDELYILQKDVMRCLDLQYGAEMWRANLPFPVSSGPVVDETQYYLGSYDRRIYAMPKKKSIEQWNFITGGEIKSPGALGAAGQVYFTSTDKTVCRLEPTGGYVPGKSWRFTTGSRVTGSPVFFSRWLFVGSTDFKLYSFEVDGTRAWEFPAEASIASTPVVMSFRPDKPLVFCISEDDRKGEVKHVGWALDAKTGQQVWRREDVAQVVAMGRRAVYLIPDKMAGGQRRLVAVDALKGDELFQLPVERFDIIPTNDADHGMNHRQRGVIYLISRTGHMQAIREKP